MVNVFSKKMYWFIFLVLIGIVAVSLVIISVYLPPENKMSEIADEICTDSTKTEACKEALLLPEIWGVKKWTKTFGDPGYYDAADSVQQTSDGGFIIIGTTGRNASNFTRCASTYFIKTDKDGNKVWENIFGADECISGKSAQQTSDGGYIITGVISMPLKKVGDYGAKYKSNIYLGKTDADGNIIWEKNNRAGDTDEWGWGKLVQQTADGGYIVLGVVYVSSNAHIYLLKVDTNGNMQWNKTFGEYYSEIGYSVQQTSDGGYIVVADTRRGIEVNEGDIHLIKTDADGNTVWDKLIDPLGQHENDYPLDAKQTSDGGFIIIEYTEDESGTGLGDVYLLKINPDGNMNWRKILGRFSGYLVDIASDEGYIIIGENREGYIIKMKTDTDGNVLWTKAIFENVPDLSPHFYNSIQQTSDGGYLVYTNQEFEVGEMGGVNTDIVLVKIDETPTSRPPVEKEPVIFEELRPATEVEWLKGTGRGWYKTFEEGLGVEGYSVQQTTDGGFIVAGKIYYGGVRKPYGLNETIIFPQSDIYLLKTDKDGNKVWDKSFGDIKSESDVGHSVQQTNDGGYITVGSTHTYSIGVGGELSYDKGDDVYLIKTDANGNMQWNKTFGEYYNEAGHSVQQTSDGGYIIVGEMASYRMIPGMEEVFSPTEDVYLIKTDENGNKLWENTFGGRYVDIGYSVKQTSDGGYVIVGVILQKSNTFFLDVYLIKTDANGNKVWEKALEGNKSEIGYSVQQTSDGGYIVTGQTVWSPLGGTGGYFKKSDVLLIKTDANGNKVWEKTFGGNTMDRGYSVQQTKDGGYIVTGDTAGYLYLIKTDANGNKIWENAFKGDETSPFTGQSIQQTIDGGYIIVGNTPKLFYLIKTDENGDI